MCAVGRFAYMRIWVPQSSFDGRSRAIIVRESCEGSIDERIRFKLQDLWVYQRVHRDAVAAPGQFYGGVGSDLRLSIP